MSEPRFAGALTAGPPKPAPDVGRERAPKAPTVLLGPGPGLWSYRGLVRRLAVRHVRARYSHSTLGIYWALINPLLTALVLSAVFGQMLRIIKPEAPYVVFVLSGLVVWNLFANSMTDATTSVTDYAALMGKVRFPREVLPIAAVSARLVDFAFSCAVLVLFILVSGLRLTLEALWALPILGILLVFTLGVALAVSALNAIYRDVGQAVSLILLLWFYFSPVIYSVRQVAEPYRSLLILNPLAPLIDGFRQAVVLGQRPDLAPLAPSALMSVVMLLAGWWVFRRLQHQFAEIL